MLAYTVMNGVSGPLLDRLGTKLGYDARGNLSTREITLNGLSGSYVYTYGYDDQDRLTQKTLPAGSPDQAVQTFVYTSDGLLSDSSTFAWTVQDVLPRHKQ